MQIKTLLLTNYRCFPSLKVDFHKNLTVLVAPNGQGKTAVLDALAVALGPFVSAFDEGKDAGFAVDDIRLIRAKDGSNTMEYAADGVSLEARGYVPFAKKVAKADESFIYDWQRRLAGSKSRTTRKEASILTKYGKQLQTQVRREAESGDSGVVLPIIAYYDTGRLWNIRRLPYKKLSRTSRMVGYTHCLESGSDYHLLADWFRYWSTNAWKAKIEAEQRGVDSSLDPFSDPLEVLRNAVNHCLQPTGWGDIDFSMAKEELVAYHPEHGELPAAMLSDGIRSMLALVADIAFRAAKLNPNLGPLAAKHTPGIVLIDEVDMHLHPEWQQLVLSQLQEAFPNVQFIVTTHSPQVLSTIKKESIRVLGKNYQGEYVAEMPLARSYGEISSDVLQSIMLVDPQPPIQERKDLDELIELVDQGYYDSKKAINLKNTLEKALGENHPQMQKIERSINRQKSLHQS